MKILSNGYNGYVRKHKGIVQTTVYMNLMKMSFSLIQDLRARQVLAAIGKSGKYNAGGKNIEGSWVSGFKEGMERLIGKAYAITKEDRYYIERLRRKCTSTKSWNYERVYKVAFKGADPVGLFQQPVESAPRSCQSIEESLHSKFPLAADIRLIGRRRNISASGSDDNNLYYIGKGSVFCSGTKKSCRCSEGYIEVMVEELFPHDGSLQKFGGESHEEISTQVIQPHSRLMWHQSLVRHMPKENLRTKAKQRKKMSKDGKENGVRKSMREPKFSSKIVEIINQGVFARPPKGGAKRGRKRKGGAPVRTIEASKPVTSVVERPGKRRTTKLALE